MCKGHMPPKIEILLPKQKVRTIEEKPEVSEQLPLSLFIIFLYAVFLQIRKYVKKVMEKWN